MGVWEQIIIPLKADKTVDVAFLGVNTNSGNVYRAKIYAIGYLKDCTWNCWTCTTTNQANCTECRPNYYLYSVTDTCVTNCSSASSNSNFFIFL